MTQLTTLPMPGELRILPPLSLYIHFPWCLRKCPYCDFNSHEVGAGFNENAYIDALLTDLELALPQVWGRPVTSIFIGGGTPSLLSAAAMERLLAGVRARLRGEPGAEVTLEANPGTVESDKFQGFRAAGVNRLSLGVQSFATDHLSAIGRIHTGPTAQRALEVALTHFDNVNVDLMYALPGQSCQQALNDIRIAISYRVSHLSAYHLTIEPNTLFHRYQPHDLPNQDTAADMQEAIEAMLADAGWEHYETSAFSQVGQRCRHNLNYWQFGDYLGIGAGAHAKISSSEGIIRESRFKQPTSYMKAVAQGAPVQSRRRLTRQELPFEFMMNLLRLTQGFESRLFSERTGLPMRAIERELELAQQQGLIEFDQITLRPSKRGQRFLNDLLMLFLTEGKTA